MWNPSTCDCARDETCEIGELLDIKNCVRKDHVTDNLVLTCEDETLSTRDYVKKTLLTKK